MNRRAFAAAFAAMLSIAAPGVAQPPSAAQRPTAPQTVPDSVLDARTAAVSATLRCPVCQGESIQDSPAELAQQMRAIVRDKLRAGETPDDIRDYFVARYGEWILLEPAMTGLNILLYVFPVLLVVGGLVFVFVLVKRWTTPQPLTPQHHVNEPDAG